MKRTLIIIFITFISIPCFAQWKNAGFSPYPIIAFGVHDSSFFLSIPGHLYGYNVSVSDVGINFSQGDITSFGSLGTYVFAGQSKGTEYRSTDNGGNWSENIGSPVYSNGTYLFGFYGSNIARSSDSGNHWEHLSTTLPVQSYASIGWTIFANIGNALWRSSDSGTHWSQLSQPFSGNVTLNVYTMDSVLILVDNDPSLRSATAGGMMAVSYDLGNNWTKRSLVIGNGNTDVITALASKDSILFAGSLTSGVFISKDTGATWKAINDSLPIAFYPLHVTAMGIFDTLLFADLTANGEYNLFVRSIPEMLADTAPSSVVQTLSSDDTIEIYPNPATGTVTILAGDASLLGVSVLNVLGEDVLDMPNLRESDITLDVSKIPSGTYFLRIQTVESIVLRKIVINK